jgi:hypothetical protein
VYIVSVASLHTSYHKVGLKSVQNHLADLTILGFLEQPERNGGRADGIHYLYELTLDPEIVLETREAIETEELS